MISTYSDSYRQEHIQEIRQARRNWRYWWLVITGGK